jgi:PHD/YefM family antitoxin component YafN of YafNO toxin-antitoxin module
VFYVYDALNESNARYGDMKVSTAELVRNFGVHADKALAEPVTITKNGRDRLVLLSVEEYERLRRRDREVIRPGQLTAGERAALAAAEVPAEHAALDAELLGWAP